MTVHPSRRSRPRALAIPRETTALLWLSRLAVVASALALLAMPHLLGN